MRDDFSTEKWPIKVRLRNTKDILDIHFNDGSEFSLTAELLRVESPSAEVQGHMPSQKQILSGRRHVNIMELEPVGNYAIRIKFDDLHDTGIFSWQYLYHLGSHKTKLWNRYLKNLDEKGLSRDP